MKKYSKVIICFALSLLLMLISLNNFSMYSSPILKITAINESGLEQVIQGELKNGEHQGEVIELISTYEEDYTYTDKYSEGNYLFLSEDLEQIVGVKRDYIVVMIFLILANLLVIILGKQGFFTLVGLISNTLIFGVALVFYDANANVLLVSIIISMIFAGVVLVSINGFTKKTCVVYTCTLASSLFIFLISLAVITFGPSIDYEFLEYLPDSFSVTDSNMLFLSEILIGSLGVILDVSVTVTTCGEELLQKNQNISIKELMTSMRHLADDITGTMINVVFFTSIGGLLPIYIISVKNDIHFLTILRYDGFFMFARFLISSTAIVAAIPISLYIASKVYKKRRAKV